MNVTATDRGFALIEFEDDNGVACSLQESSSALEPKVWLGCTDPNPKTLPGDGTGWHPYPLPENVQCTTRMHLTREQVAALLPWLHAFVRHGCLAQAPSPLGDLRDVIAEYDRITDESAAQTDDEWDFVMRASDWRTIRAALPSDGLVAGRVSNEGGKE